MLSDAPLLPEFRQAAAEAVLGLKAGTVVVPGIGTMSGAAAGFLAGMFMGTVSCVMINETFKDELRKLANGE